MAPRRGGGGGGYYSSSTSDICPGGFQDWYSQTIIAFDALYCVVFLVFFIVVGRRAKKTKTGGLAKCLTYISLTFAFAYASSPRLPRSRYPIDHRTNFSSHILLQIVFNTLAQCGRIDIIENNAGMTASMWMFILMYYCLYTLILAPICHRLHNGSALVKIVTTIFLALLGVVLIAYLCLYTRITHAANIRESDTWEKYFLHSIRLITAYRVIEMVAMLIAAGLILSAMFRAAHLRAQVYRPPYRSGKVFADRSDFSPL